MSNEEWFGTDIEADDARPIAIAELLETVATTVREAPDDRRYDLQLEIEER
jgi:hypothetical protein